MSKEIKSHHTRPTRCLDLLKEGTTFPLSPLNRPVLPVIKPDKNRWYLPNSDHHTLDTMVPLSKLPYLLLLKSRFHTIITWGIFCYLHIADVFHSVPILVASQAQFAFTFAMTQCPFTWPSIWHLSNISISHHFCRQGLSHDDQLSLGSWEWRYIDDILLWGDSFDTLQDTNIHKAVHKRDGPPTLHIIQTYHLSSIPECPLASQVLLLLWYCQETTTDPGRTYSIKRSPTSFRPFWLLKATYFSFTNFTQVHLCCYFQIGSL